MKLNKNIFVSISILLGLSSCVSEDMKVNEKNGKGNLMLEISALEPTSTRATINTDNFAVELCNAEGTQLKAWEKVTDVEKSIVLPTGKYIVKSHMKGTCPKKSYEPFYSGEEEVEIFKGESTKAEVTCTMENTRFQFNLSDKFLSNFAEWTITIDDGTGLGLSSVWNGNNNEDGTKPQAVYVKLADNTKTLSINYRAVTKDGNTVNGNYSIQKSAASESYQDDQENFSGGDALVLNFNPTASSTGTVDGIVINGHVSWNTIDGQEITVEVEDANSNTGGNGNNEGGEQGGSQGGGDASDAVTLNLPQPITLSDDTDPSLGDVNISCPAGIKSILVTVTSTSDGEEGMMGQLAEVANQYDGVDLVNGCEVVGNTALVDFLEGLGQEISVPSEGDKSYTFPIGNFFAFLGILPGDHNFTLTVTDMNGVKNSGTVTVTVPE